MPGPSKIEAYAIVSADGMLADANRRIPPALVVVRALIGRVG